MSRSWGVLVAALALGACSKSEDKGKAQPAPAPAPVVVEDAGADASTSTSTKGGEYSGKYSLAPGAMYIPSTKDYGKVKQAKDDPTKYVGDGALSLKVDEHGRVTGTIESGPAAPAEIDGSLVGDEIRGVVRRKDPADRGLTGTFVVAVGSPSAEGKLSLAESDAAIVREGKLTLEKK